MGERKRLKVTRDRIINKRTAKGELDICGRGGGRWGVRQDKEEGMVPREKGERAKWGLS